MSQYLTTVPSGFGTLFPPPPSQVTTTYHFRTTFLFSGITNSVQLVATNLVDDVGCAIWLNGQLAGTLRLPTNGSFNATTFAQGGPSAEGLPEVLNLRGEPAKALDQLAVEVHQIRDERGCCSRYAIDCGANAAAGHHQSAAKSEFDGGRFGYADGGRVRRTGNLSVAEERCESSVHEKPAGTRQCSAIGHWRLSCDLLQ